MNNGIGIDNYEEYFLLDIDGELNKKQHGEVDRFILLHPELQPAFTLLQQSVLEPEQIVFADKASLYRKEERRVIPFGWKQMAVAAALIGITVAIWWLMPAGKENNSVAKVQTDKATITPLGNDTAIEINKQSIKPIEQTNNDVAVTKPEEDKKNNAVVAKKVEVKSNMANKKNIAVNNNNLADNSVKHHEQKTAVTNEVLPEKKDEPIVAYNDQSNDNNNGEHSQVVTANVNQADIAANNIIQPAVYKELNTDDDKDQSLYVGSLNLNKNKLRGVFKKVGGIFAAKSKTAIASNEQGKLQVAGLEFNKN